MCARTGKTALFYVFFFSERWWDVNCSEWIWLKINASVIKESWLEKCKRLL